MWVVRGGSDLRDKSPPLALNPVQLDQMRGELPPRPAPPATRTARGTPPRYLNLGPRSPLGHYVAGRGRAAAGPQTGMPQPLPPPWRRGGGNGAGDSPGTKPKPTPNLPLVLGSLFFGNIAPTERRKNEPIIMTNCHQEKTERKISGKTKIPHPPLTPKILACCGVAELSWHHTTPHHTNCCLNHILPAINPTL